MYVSLWIIVLILVGALADWRKRGHFILAGVLLAIVVDIVRH